MLLSDNLQIRPPVSRRNAVQSHLSIISCTSFQNILVVYFRDRSFFLRNVIIRILFASKQNPEYTHVQLRSTKLVNANPAHDYRRRWHRLTYDAEQEKHLFAFDGRGYRYSETAVSYICDIDIEIIRLCIS